MIMRRLLRGWAAALICIGAIATETGAQSVAQRGSRPGRRLVPNAVKKSNLEVRLSFVGRIPTFTNPTSPVIVGSQLLLIDQSGYIYRWDGTAVHGLLTPTSTLADITLTGRESVLNAAADA